MDHRWLLVAPLLILLVVLQWKYWFGQGGVVETRQLERSIAQVQSENQVLQARNDALKQRIRDLETRNEAIEGVARRELGWVRPEETFFMVVPLASD